MDIASASAFFTTQMGLITSLITTVLLAVFGLGLGIAAFVVIYRVVVKLIGWVRKVGK